MSVDTEKYKNAILYLCQQLHGEIRGKKKLAKLLYFVDFDLYEKEYSSLTGDTYRALPMGPVPSALESITQEMVKNKMLSVQSVEEHEEYLPTEVYTCLASPDLSVFSSQEKQMLDRTVLNYGHLNGKQLEVLSHAEAPYIGTELRQEIPYELAFYRGTNFSEA